MAVSTCDGSIAPDEHAAPVETASSLQIERDHQRFTFDAIKVDVGGVRNARRTLAIHAVPSTALRELPCCSRSRSAAIFSIVAVSEAFAGATCAALPKPTIPGTFSVPARRERSWLSAMKASAAAEFPCVTYSAPIALRSMHLVARNRQQIAADAHIDRNLARRLHRVSVEVNIGFSGDFADLLDRLQHAGLVVRHHDGDQLGVRPQRPAHVVGIDQACGRPPARTLLRSPIPPDACRNSAPRDVRWSR